ncbi:putative LysR-family transcriptional regulator [Yersinia pseudotuberculosis]|nr:glycine cleavage system transcriptional activator [Yersinia pseudotuberculosis]SUP82210.1 putative LysR-family transcriptional regulator [Yersinia pseudotuberculosis]
MSIDENTFAFSAKINNHAIYKHLENFIKIVECNSLSIAAHKLNITPSSTSRSLAQLEEKLGVVLLKRTTRSIVLTDAGDYLFHQARQLLLDLDETLVNTHSFYNHPQGQLKITCSIAFGVCHLMNLFSQYKETNSDVCLSVDLNDQLVNLNEEHFDIALRITSIPPPNFAIRRICTINWVYCGSKEYLMKRGVPATIEDLEQHDCLVNPNVSDAWLYKSTECESVPLKIKNTVQANSSLGLLHAALHHQGIVCLPTYMLGDYITSGKLVPILLDYNAKDKEYGLYALYYPSKYNDPKIRSFIDFMLDELSMDVPWDKWRADYQISLS